MGGFTILAGKAADYRARPDVASDERGKWRHPYQAMVSPL